MNTSLRYRCCAAVDIDPTSRKGETVEQAATIADAWYAANPMPMGSAAVASRHHKACSSHVSSEIRMKCGLITWLTIFSCLLSICYTVWQWRRQAETNRDATQRS